VTVESPAFVAKPWFVRADLEGLGAGAMRQEESGGDDQCRNDEGSSAHGMLAEQETARTASAVVRFRGHIGIEHKSRADGRP